MGILRNGRRLRGFVIDCSALQCLPCSFGSLDVVKRTLCVRSRILLSSALCVPSKLNTEVVQGTWNALAALLKDMGVDHGRGKIVVPEQLLNGADVGATLEQVSGK